MSQELVYCKHGGADTKNIDFNIPIGDNQELVLCRQCHLVIVGAVARELAFGGLNNVSKDIAEAVINKFRQNGIV